MVPPQTCLPAISATVRGCEKIARKRARQAEPPTPPLKMQDLLWWRRRFRLRSWILSQHLRERLLAIATVIS